MRNGIAYHMAGTYPCMEPLTELLDSAVSRAVSGRRAAVAFSGGLDSGLIAYLAKLHADSVTLYTVGTEGSYDVRASEDMASRLDADWVFIELDEETAMASLSEAVSVTGTVDPVTLSFETPLACVLGRCVEDLVLTGQGADEVFAGYSKYLDLDHPGFRAKQAEDLVRLRDVTLVHERLMAEHHGKTAAYPFLDPSVVAYGASLGPEILPQGELRKHALRSAAEDLNLPFVASKTKKAAQYGSGAMQLFRRISKKRGQSFNELIIGLQNQQHT